MEITLYLHFLQLCTVARFFSLQEIKITFRKLVSTRFYNFLLFKTFPKLINFCHGFEGFFIFFTGLSINTYTNLDKMASRLHSKKKHKNKNKTEKRNKNNNNQKKWKNKESFPLTRCWRHVLWADVVKLLLSAQGKLKPKHLSLFIMGGGGGERMKGGSHGFQGNRGGRNSHC